MARSPVGRRSAPRPPIARPLIGRLARPLLAVAPSAAARLPPSRPAARRTRGRREPGAARLRLGLARRRCLALLSRHRRLRLVLLVCLAASPVLAGGWLWLRHSSLVAVKHVHVSGVHGPEAGAIEAALTGAARRMSTLEVNVRALRASVASFPVVRGVSATASFPHGLRIHVSEQLPVAVLVSNGAKTAVAADGVVLGPALLSGSLPTVAASSPPAATGRHLGDAGVLGALTVLGAAPGPFAKVIARAYTGPNGLTVAMRNGLLAYFGDPTRPHAKWLSLARVLADSSSHGASYVDVRVPERPAAGFPSGMRPAGTTGSGGASEAAATTSGAGSEGTIAALAAGLAGPAEREASPSSGEASGGHEAEAQSTPPAIEGGSPSARETGRTSGPESASEGGTPGAKGP
jgi:cell division protein FtsQ